MYLGTSVRILQKNGTWIEVGKGGEGATVVDFIFAGNTIDITFNTPRKDTNYDVTLDVKFIWGYRLGIEPYTITNKTANGFSIVNNALALNSYPVFRTNNSPLGDPVGSYNSHTYNTNTGGVLAMETHTNNGTNYRVLNLSSTATKDHNYSQAFTWLWGSDHVHLFQTMINTTQLSVGRLRSNTSRIDFIQHGGATNRSWIDTSFQNNFRMSCSVNGKFFLFYSSRLVQARNESGVLQSSFIAPVSYNGESLSYNPNISVDEGEVIHLMARGLTTNNVYILSYNINGVLLRGIVVGVNASITQSHFIYSPKTECVLQVPSWNFDQTFHVYYPVIPSKAIITDLIKSRIIN